MNDSGGKTHTHSHHHGILATDGRLFYAKYQKVPEPRMQSDRMERFRLAPEGPTESHLIQEATQWLLYIYRLSLPTITTQTIIFSFSLENDVNAVWQTARSSVSDSCTLLSPATYFPYPRR